VWHSRPRLSFLFFPEFGVTGFPAVGDLGQELADAFDFVEGPEVDSHPPGSHGFGSGNFPSRYVTAQGGVGGSKFLSRLPRGVGVHLFQWYR